MLSPTSIDYFEIILAAEASQLETNIQGIRGGGVIRTYATSGGRTSGPSLSFVSADSIRHKYDESNDPGTEMEESKNKLDGFPE